jgi:hypothetical protein
MPKVVDIVCVGSFHSVPQQHFQNKSELRRSMENALDDAPKHVQDQATVRIVLIGALRERLFQNTVR